MWKPEPERYTGLVRQTKEKSKERKSLPAKKKETSFYQIPKLYDLTRRITELTEKIEQLRSEKALLYETKWASEHSVWMLRSDALLRSGFFSAPLANQKEARYNVIGRFKRRLLEKYDLVPNRGTSLTAATVRGLILTVSHKEQIGELYPQVLETLVYGACRELFK